MAVPVQIMDNVPQTIAKTDFAVIQAGAALIIPIAQLYVLIM
jgi:hypothetical protein